MTASSDHPSESAASQGITRSLARYVVATRFDELPAAVRREAQRSLLNWMGVTVAAGLATKRSRSRSWPRSGRSLERRRRRYSAGQNGSMSCMRPSSTA